jgi:pimeloyl-ACP methyl ester carboxylesterase
VRQEYCLLGVVWLLFMSLLIALPALAATDFVGERRGNSLVVFVHGIGGDGDGTWRNGETYWPKMVAEDPAFLGFDVVVYEYPSSILGQSRSISDLARLMRDELQAPRIGISQYENVVFITHSLGGIVVREYILDNIETSTNVIGIFAFAAPMNGSHLANLASKIGRGTTIDELKNDRSAKGYVSKMIDRWTGKRPRIQVRNWCAYETNPLYGTQIQFLKVVDAGSARLLCSEDTRSVTGDHWQIVKPESEQSFSHQLIQRWLGEAMANMQPAVNEAEKDIVFANCSDSPYGLATQSEMFAIADEISPDRRVRLSRRLPVEYNASVRSLLWEKAKPSLLIIHLSCFQKGPETDENAVERTNAFINLLDRMKRDKIKFLVYSRAFIADPNYRDNHIPKRLNEYYGSRAVFLPYNANKMFSKDYQGQQEFRAALKHLIDDNSDWPNL